MMVVVYIYPSRLDAMLVTRTETHHLTLPRETPTVTEQDAVEIATRILLDRNTQHFKQAMSFYGYRYTGKWEDWVTGSPSAFFFFLNPSEAK